MFENPLINAFATLIITVGVVALLLFLVKKYSGKFTSNISNAKQIKIEAKQAISSKSNIFIVNIEGRRFAIAANDSSISKISELDSEPNKNTANQENSIDYSIPKELQEEVSFSSFLKQSIFKQK